MKQSTIIKIKSINLKLIQILLFTISIYIYIELTSNLHQFKDESKEEVKQRKELAIYKWFAGIIVFSIAWSIGTFKWLSRTFLMFFIIRSIQQLIQHLPSDTYHRLIEWSVGTVGYINSLVGISTNEIYIYTAGLLEYVLPNTIPFSIDIIGAQILSIVFFAALGFNIYLADKFWLIKTIILDWIISAILLVVFAATDLLKKENKLFLVVSYIFGSNILGFGTIKLQEYFWNLSSTIDNSVLNNSNKEIAAVAVVPTTAGSNEDIIYDTDSTYSNEDDDCSVTTTTTTTTTIIEEEETGNGSFINQSTITETIMVEESNGEIIEQQVQVDNLDYSKLTEDELNTILSEPIQEIQVSTRNVQYHKPTQFINNLIAPENINSRISAKEFVGVVILWVYTISNIIIQDYSIYTTPNILVVAGFSGTILTYLSTISAKRLTNKNPSKREC